MFNLLVALIIIVALLLVLVILAQNSKGGGLTAEMSSASQLMGARRTTDWIEKATWVLGAALFVLSLTSNMILDERAGSGDVFSPNIESATGLDSTPTTDDLEVIQPENQEEVVPETVPTEEENNQ